MFSNASSANEKDIQHLQFELASREKWERWIESLAWVVFEVVTLIGNSASLKIIFCNPSLRTIPNFLIASLAMSDLGLGILSGLPSLGVLITSKWPYSEQTCQFQGIAAITFACASILNLTFMALNRYFRVVRQTKYRTYFTLKRTVCYIAIVWVLSILGSLSYVALGYKYVFHPGKFVCYINVEDYIFLSVLVTFYIAFPANVIAFCYFKVYRVIKKHNNSMSNSQNLSSHEIKITRTLFVILIMFMICWIPIFIIDIIDVIRLRWSLTRKAYVAYSFLAASSCAINPILYGFMNPNFGKEYNKLFRMLLRLPPSHVEVSRSGTVLTVGANVSTAKTTSQAIHVPVELK